MSSSQPSPAYRALNYIESFAPRNELIRAIETKTHFDLVVIGGGIHGAWSALLGALAGLSVALFEKNDYASQTSSRSSKMVHGGLRYLEQLDIRQVLEGVRQRDLLLKIAPHLVRNEPFLIPLRPNDWWGWLRLKIGLSLYDLFRSDRSLRHRTLSQNDPDLERIRQMGMSVGRGFEYHDGIMNDSRLVFEVLHLAREEGAICVNHAPVQRISRSGEGLTVAWQDSLTGAIHEARAGAAMNCAGPWIGSISPEFSRRLRFSRGVHILFRVPWQGPSLLLPLPGERGRYYFVWPHAVGTMVGTTEREESSAEYDPIPRSDELSEIFERVARDLPRSGLNRQSAVYAFAGVRSLPLRGEGGEKVSEVSRRHVWEWREGVLTLLGGKYTTAEWTAREGLLMVLKKAGVPLEIPVLAHRQLPGAVSQSIAKVDEFRSLCRERGVSVEIFERVVARYGVRALGMCSFPRWDEVLPHGILRGEVLFGCEIEQAERVEDILARRLDLTLTDNHGLELLEEVESILRQRGSTSARKESLAYRGNIQKIRSLLANE